MSLRCRLPLTFLSAYLLGACASHGGAGAKTPSVAELRRNAEHDSQQTGAWYLAELVSPDGNPERVKQARQALDKAQAKDVLAELGRGLDDFAHGHLKRAPEHMLLAVQAARESQDPRAELLGWYAARQAIGFRSNAGKEPEKLVSVNIFCEQLNVARPKSASAQDLL